MFKKFPDIDYAPIHPGETLREDILPALSLSHRELARQLKLSPTSLDDFLAGRRKVTKKLAERLGTVVGYGPRYWLGLQRQHDLWATAVAASTRGSTGRRIRN